MRSAERVSEVLRLKREGLTALHISRRTGVARSTVRDWLAGRTPRGAQSPPCAECGGPAHDFATLPPEYVYLLGIYLGDGYIASHPRGVHKLRVTLDSKYPAIVSECESAMRAVAPGNAVRRRTRVYNDIEVYSYSKSWPCLLPQHTTRGTLQGPRLAPLPTATTRPRPRAPCSRRRMGARRW